MKLNTSYTIYILIYYLLTRLLKLYFIKTYKLFLKHNTLKQINLYNYIFFYEFKNSNLSKTTNFP